MIIILPLMNKKIILRADVGININVWKYRNVEDCEFLPEEGDTAGGDIWQMPLLSKHLFYSRQWVPRESL